MYTRNIEDYIGINVDIMDDGKWITRRIGKDGKVKHNGKRVSLIKNERNIFYINPS